MVDGIDQHRDSQYVREQDKFLALVVAHLTRPGQELYPLHPLFRGELNLANKGVQVVDEAGHDLLEPGVGRVRHAIQHILGNLLFAVVAHYLSSLVNAERSSSGIGIDW